MYLIYVVICTKKVHAQGRSDAETLPYVEGCIPIFEGRKIDGKGNETVTSLAKPMAGSGNPYRTLHPIPSFSEQGMFGRPGNGNL